MKEARTVLITGATSGIGLACAIGMAGAGYNIVACGRRKNRLEEAERLCREQGAAFQGIRCDIRDEEAVTGLFNEAQERFGHIDVVFNNAGVFPPATRIDETGLETFQNAIDINLTGAFLVAREAFRRMKGQSPQGGRIINNGSISAHAPRPNATPYTVSKHAITGLTKSISLEGRPFNIACSQIDIGNTATDMTVTMETGMLQANGTMACEPTFDVTHVVEAVLYMAALPLEANVQFMTLMATGMPYVGRG